MAGELCNQSLLTLILYFQEWDVQYHSGYSLGSTVSSSLCAFVGQRYCQVQSTWPSSHQAHSSLPCSINSTQGTKTVYLIENVVNFRWSSCRTKKQICCVVYFHLCFFALNGGSIQLIGIFGKEITFFPISFSM